MAVGLERCGQLRVEGVTLKAGCQSSTPTAAHHQEEGVFSVLLHCFIKDPRLHPRSDVFPPLLANLDLHLCCQIAKGIGMRGKKGHEMERGFGIVPGSGRWALWHP